MKVGNLRVWPSAKFCASQENWTAKSKPLSFYKSKTLAVDGKIGYAAGLIKERSPKQNFAAGYANTTDYKSKGCLKISEPIKDDVAAA